MLALKSVTQQSGSREAIYIVLCIFGVAAIIVVAYFIIDVICDRLRRSRDQSRPIYKVRARVLDKRTSCLSLSLNGNCRQISHALPDDTFILFQLQDQTVELVAADEIYVKVVVGSEGWLVYRGSTVIEFTPF